MHLNCVITIIDRNNAEFATTLYEEAEIPLILTMLGSDPNAEEQLDKYGFQSEEKAVIVAVATADKTRQLIKNAKRKLLIDVPGYGMIMAVPIKSVGGGKTLAYLTNNSVTEKIDKKAPKMKFVYELILVVLNQSYMDDVMQVARAAGASGGTVLHAKGTSKEAQKFFGVSLANEKEVIMIVAKANEKEAIMKAILEHTGPETPAGAITFSLPILTAAGISDAVAEG